MMDTNILFSMVMATIMNIIAHFISDNLKNLLNFISEYIDKKYYPPSKYEITLYGIMILSNSGTYNYFPDEYYAINYLIVKNKVNINKISKMFSLGDTFYIRSYNPDLNEKPFYVTSNQKIKFELEKNIYVSFSVGSEEGQDIKKKKVYITIGSNHYNLYELDKKIHAWTLDYKCNKEKYNDDGKLYYYSLTDNIDVKKDELKIMKLKWKVNVLKSYKTFDNTFFSDREILLKKLNYFLENEEEYQRRGIPYNIGFLLYGSAGCGKTSCIKAISNLTNRHIVEVNLKNIKTCDEFIKIFNDDELNGQYIPHHKKIIVLEDIDCMIDIVKERKNDNETEYPEEEGEETTTVKSKLKSAIDQNQLTLSCILNTIDGILENYGRILIMTTNHVEKLDKALIRAGRIDMKINFTKCDNKMYHDIINNYFHSKIDKKIIFKEYLHSPAELLELCHLHNDNVNNLLNKLQKI